MASFSDPVLSIMRHPVAELSARGVDMLIAQLAGSAAPEGALLPCTLRIGATTASVPLSR